MESLQDCSPKKPRLSYDSSLQRRTLQASWKIKARARLFRKAAMFKGFTTDEFQKSNGSFLRSIYNVNHKEMQELKLEKHLFGILSHRCSRCSQLFSLETHFNKHMQFCHTSVFSPGRIGQTTENENRLQDSFSQMLVCPWCPLLCSSMPALQKHLPNCREAGRQKVKAEILKRFPCPECPTQFATLKNLLFHLQSHYVGDILCNPCNKSFLNMKSLSKHLQTCTSKEFYKCSDCGKPFIDASHLMKHLPRCRSYTQCLKCAEAVIERRSCMDHMTMHLHAEWSRLGLKLIDGVLHKVPRKTEPSPVTKPLLGVPLYELALKYGKGSAHKDIVAQTPVKLSSPFFKTDYTSSSKIGPLGKTTSESSVSQTFGSLKMLRLDLSSSSDEEDHFNVDPINFDDWSCDEMSESADDNFPVFHQGVYEIENNRGDSEFVDEPEISCSDLSYNIAAAEDMTDPLMPDLEVQQNPLREAQDCMRTEEVPDPPMPNLPIEDDILSEELSAAHSLCSLATFDSITADVREPAVVDLKKNTSHLFTPAANDSDLMLTVVNVEGGANLFNWDDDCDTNNEVIPESSGTRSENAAPSYPHSFQTSSYSDSHINTESKSDGNEDGDSGIDATDDQDSNRDKMEELDAGHGTNVPGTTLPIEASEISPIPDTADKEMNCHATEPCDKFLGDEILVPHENTVSSEVFISSSVCDNEVVVGCPVEIPPKKPYSVVNEHSYAVPEGQLLPWFQHQEDKPKAKSRTRTAKPAEQSNIMSIKRKKKKSLEQSVQSGNAKINVDVQKVSEGPVLGKNGRSSKKTHGSKKKIESNSDQPLHSRNNESASQQPFDSANDGTNQLVSEPANLCGTEITGICSISVNEASSEVFSNSAANSSIDIVTPQMLVDKPAEVETNNIKIQSESDKTSTNVSVSGLKKCVKMSTSFVPKKVSGLVKLSDQTMIPLIKNGRTIAYLRAAPTLVPIKTAPSNPMVVVRNSQLGSSCTAQPKAMPPKSSTSSVLGETKSNPLPSTSKDSYQTIVSLPDVKAPDQSEKVSPNVRHSGDLVDNSQVLCNQLIKENHLTEKRTGPQKPRKEVISSSCDPCRNNKCQNATDEAMLKVYRRERSMLSRGFKQIAVSFPHRKDSSDTDSQVNVGDSTYSSTVALSVETQETPDTCVPKGGFSGQASRKCTTVLKESVNSELQKSVQPESSSSDNFLMFIVANDGSLVPYPNIKPLPPSAIAGSKENMPPTGSVSITHAEAFIIDSEVLEVTGGKQSDSVHEELQEKSVTSALQTRYDALQHSSVNETDDKGAAYTVSLNDAHKSLSEHSPPEIKETSESNSVEIIQPEQAVEEISKPESIFSVPGGKGDGSPVDECHVDELHVTEHEASGPPTPENMKIMEKEALPAAANLSECLNEESHSVMPTDVFDSASTVLNGKHDENCVNDKINKSSSRFSPIQICHMELCSDSSNEEPESSNIQGNGKTDSLMKTHDLNQGEVNSQVHMDLRSDERSYWPDSDHEMSSGSSNIDDSELATPPNECSDLFQNAVDELLLVNLLKSLKLTTYANKNKIVKHKRRKNQRYLYWTNILYSRKLMKEMNLLKRRRFGREGLLKDTGRFNCNHCTQWFYLKADLEHHICLKFLIQNKLTSERFDRFFDSKDAPQKGENDNTNINLSRTPSVHNVQPNPAPSKATSSMSPLETFFSMKLEKKRRRFTCQKCQQNFKSFSALHDHKTDVHDEKLSLKCHICGKEFSRLQKLAVHFAKSHRANNKVAESKEDIVTDTLSAEISNIEEGSGPESSSKSESFVPNETGSLDSIIKDVNHSMDPAKIDVSDPATDNEAECCKICNKTFSANGGLKSHMNQAHATIYKCPICLRRFTYLSTMKTHFMKHFGSTSNSLNVPEAPESTPVINGCNEDNKLVSDTHSAKKDIEAVALTKGTHVSLSEDKRDIFSLDTKSQEEPIEESSIILETIGKTRECHPIAEDTGVSFHPERVEDPQIENVDKQKHENSNVPSEALGVALQDKSSIGKRALDDLGTADPSHGKKRRKCKWIISSPEKNKTAPETINGPAESGSEKLVISLSKVKRPRHKCQDCEKSFKKQHHLALHRLEVHTNGPFTCPVCHAEQSDTVQLQIHLEKCDDIPNNKNLTRSNKEKTYIESNPNNKNLLTVSGEIGVVSPPLQACVDNFDDASSNKEIIKGNNEEACLEASPNKAISFTIPSHQSCDSKVNRLNGCETQNLSRMEEKSQHKNVSEDVCHSQSDEQIVSHLVKTSAFSSALHITGKRRSKKNARYLEFEDSLRAFKSRQLNRDVWQCKECTMKYISKGLLERHNVRVHGAPSRFNCPHCGKIFIDARNLHLHTKKKHAKKKSLCSNIGHDNPPQSGSTENADVTTSLESEPSATLVVSEENAETASPVDPKENASTATPGDPKENADPATPGDSEENSKPAIPLDMKINLGMVSSEFSNDAHDTADSMNSVADAPGVVDNSRALMPGPSQLVESTACAGSSSAEQPASGPVKELTVQRPHTFECSECMMKYRSEVILQKHKIKVHGAPCKFYCRHCKIVFAEARSLSYHYKNTHRKKRDRKQKSLLSNCTANTSVQSESTSVVTPDTETSTEPASSDVVKRSETSQLVESQAPVSSSAPTRPHNFQCSECKTKYMSEVILQKHKIRVHGAPCKFYCRHCKTDFSEASSLSYHYKNTHRKKRDRKKKGSKRSANSPAQSEPTKLVKAVTPLDSQADPVSSEAISDINTTAGSGCCVMDAASSDVVKKSETMTSNSSQLTESLAPVSLSTAEQAVIGPPEDSVSSLAHKSSQPKRGDWPCNECELKFRNKGCLERHNIKKHGAACKFNCPYCKNIFTDARSLRFHHRTKHAKKKWLLSDSNATTSTQPKSTEIVGAGTPDSGENAHVASSDVANKAETSTSNSSQSTESLAPVSVSTTEQTVTSPPKDCVSSLAPDDSQPRRGDWLCDECKLKFRNKGCLERHNIKKHGATCKFNCPYCKNIFTDARSLRFHHKTKHAKKKWLLSDSTAFTSTQPKSTETSGFGTPSDSEANADVAPSTVVDAVVVAVDPQQCDAAPASDVMDKSETLNPGSSHLEALDPTSSQAEQPSTESSGDVRTASISIVNGKKFRKCKYCQKTFKRGIDLKKHYRIKHHKRALAKYESKVPDEDVKKESGESSTPCGDSIPEMSTTFIDSSEIGADEEGAYKCTDCPLTYRTFSCLKRHRILIHAEPASHYCNICGKGFSYPHSLKNHMMTHSRSSQNVIKSKRSERRVKCFSCEGPCDNENHNSRNNDEEPVTEKEIVDSMNTVDEPVASGAVDEVALTVSSAEDSTVPNSMMQNSLSAICTPVTTTNSCSVGSTENVTDHALGEQVPMVLNPGNSETKIDAISSAVDWNQPVLNSFPAPPFDPVPASASASGFNTIGQAPQASYPFWSDAPISPAPFLPNGSGAAVPDTNWAPPFEQMKAVNTCSLCGLCLPSWYALQEHHYRAHAHSHTYPHPNYANVYNAHQPQQEPYPAPQTVPIPWLSPWQTAAQYQSVAQNASPIKQHDASVSSFAELTSLSNAHCSVCGLGFPTLSALQEHYATHMAASAPPMSPFPFPGFY